jgi:hypothetical protein
MGRAEGLPRYNRAGSVEAGESSQYKDAVLHN